MTYPFRDHPYIPPSLTGEDRPGGGDPLGDYLHLKGEDPACARVLPGPGPTVQRIPEDPVFAEVAAERARQDAKWGEQNHPDVHVAVTDNPCLLHRVHPIPTAWDAKKITDLRADNGLVSWADIAIEELAEALEAFASRQEAAGRAEVVQLAAVCVQWARAIDRRFQQRDAEDDVRLAVREEPES